MRGVVEHRWRAMGSDAHVLVVGPARCVDRAVAAVERLEARWSRFRPTSDVARINAAPGRPVAVAPETAAALATALDARERTGGRFDPTVAAALVAAGYDRDFDDVRPRTPSTPTHRAGAPVAVDVEDRTVTAHAPVDLGGIGKGLAADLVVEQLLDDPDVDGALVNLGGDVRVAGEGPTDDGAWGVDVDGRALVALAPGSGAVTTSSTRRRRWGDAHHVIDPRTDRPSTSDLATVTVLAASAADAEVVATAALVGGRDWATDHVEQNGLAALLVDTAGRTHHAGPVEGFLRWR